MSLKAILITTIFFIYSSGMAKPANELNKFQYITITKDSVDSLNSIYFYLDAAIILPKSKEKIDAVYEQMLENPEITILIHGHTNGNKLGPIITQGTSEQLFALDNSKNKWRVGTSLGLSKHRAEAVKNYLVQKGIKEERIEVVGWGGNYMIYDKHVEKSWYNARADIEFINSNYTQQ